MGAQTDGMPVAVRAKDEMESASLAKLGEALAKAQGMMEAAAKDSTNPHFGSKFADMASVVAAIRKPLSSNGLSFFQRASSSEGGVRVETTLLHLSGEFIRDSLWLPVAQQTPQGFGSALTYARRYSLSALVGVVADDDDDGNAASAARFSPPPQKRQAKPAAPRPGDTGEPHAAAEKRHAPPPPVDGATPEEWDRATTKAPLIVDVKPGETETDAVARQTAVRLRANRLYKRLVPRATTQDGFQEWAKRLVGKAKSSEWESGDLDQLEAAAPDMERGLAEAKP